MSIKKILKPLTIAKKKSYVSRPRHKSNRGFIFKEIHHFLRLENSIL